MFVYIIIECSSSTWLVSYFEKYLDIPAKSAAWRLSIYWAGMLAGRLVITMLKPRWTLWPAVFVASVGILVANFCLSFKWHPVIGTIIVFAGAVFSGPVWPTIVSISQNVRNSSLFTSSVIGFGAPGAVVGPYLASRLIDYAGMQFLFPVLTGCCLLLFVLVFTVRVYI